MSLKIRSRLRPALALAGLVLIGAAPIVNAAEGMTVVRDPETGQLRAPTAEEAQALGAVGGSPLKSSSLAVEAVQSPLPGGGVSMQLDESTMMYSVARRNGDGSVDRYCVDGHDKAEKVMNAPQNFARPIRKTVTARGAQYETK